MTKTRKIDLLYKKAKGEQMNATAEELRELKKYKVETGEATFVLTKANLSAYVAAVDNGNCSRETFYDWCLNNGRADRRRKFSSEKSIASSNHMDVIGATFIGSVFWGNALHGLIGDAITLTGYLLLGGIISFFLWRINRRKALFLLILLPCLIIALIQLLKGQL